MLFATNMAKYLFCRSRYIIKHTCFPNFTIMRTNVLPKALPIADGDKNFENDMLRNLRVAVTPSYGQGTNSYANNTCTNTTGLAGDPQRVNNFQDIRAEILEKWDKRPQPDIHKEWLKNVMFN